MSLLRVRLEPKSPFYDGAHARARKAAPLVHSDTLHAALCAVAATTGHKNLLAAAEHLRVSALYPCLGPVHFYPRPYLPLPGLDPIAHTGADSSGRKRWKSVRLVSEGVLTAWLSADVTLPGKTTLFPGGLAVLDTEQAPFASLQSPWMIKETRPSVAIDRWLVNTADENASGTNIFQRGGLRVNTPEGFRLYFLADIPPELRTEFEATVERLGESGLGGDKSTGYGAFAVESIEETAPPAITTTPDALLTLGLYLPSQEEVAAGVLGPGAAYDSVIRGGWIHAHGGSDRMKQSVRMCLEGSVFPMPNGQPPRGEVRDLRPEGFPHPIWRSGLALGIPFHMPHDRGGA